MTRTHARTHMVQIIISLRRAGREIKTLILSKLNPLFMSIPNPDQSVINKLESTFFKFIWDGKPENK